MWDRIAGVLGEPVQRMGRPRYSPRACLEGVLYVVATGTPWSDVPYRELGLPSGETCRRRLEEWQRRGVIVEVFELLRAELDDVGLLDRARVLIDASLVEAKRGAPPSAAASVVPAARGSISRSTREARRWRSR